MMKLRNQITRALSIKQPWIWLIVNQFKDIEIRTWGTPYRGYIALHASTHFDEYGYTMIEKNNPNIQLPLKTMYITGAIVGIANLVDIIEFDTYQKFYEMRDRHKNPPEWWDGKQKGFILQDVKKKIDPTSSKGGLGLYHLDERIINRLPPP